jgi:hypothetical protein
MPTDRELFMRMLKKYGDRLDRIEGAMGKEAVPNPLVEPSDEVSSVSDTTTVTPTAPGGFQWNEGWTINEWQGEPLFDDGFEDGSVSKWDVNSNSNFGAVQDRVYEGSWSAYVSGGYASPIASFQPWSGGGTPITSVQFYYQESSNSSGSGFDIRNSNGNRELGVATDNPQWKIVDANGVNEIYSGNAYDEWHRVKVWFDWTTATPIATVEWRNMDSYFEVVSRDRPLVNGVDVAQVDHCDYHSGSFNADVATDTWIDSVVVE